MSSLDLLLNPEACSTTSEASPAAATSVRICHVWREGFRLNQEHEMTAFKRACSFRNGCKEKADL